MAMQLNVHHYDWHQSRMEGLLADIVERLGHESEITIRFQHARPDAFKRAVLQQLNWAGYEGRFETDAQSGLPKLIVRRDAIA
jgi:hypothetical protein